MNQSILSAFGATGEERVINALNAFKQGNGVLVLMMKIAKMKAI